MLRLSCLCIATLLVCADAAHAGLDGHTVTVNYLVPDIHSVRETKTVVVGPGNEATFFDGGLKIDLSDEQIKMRWLFNGILSSTSFNGLQFHIDGSFGSFASAGVNPSSTSGTRIGGVSFDNHNLYVNWSGVRLGDIQKFVVDFTLSPVPELSTGVLTVLGLAPLCAVGMRRGARRYFDPRTGGDLLRPGLRASAAASSGASSASSVS